MVEYGILYFNNSSMMKSHVKCHPFITNLGSKESYFNFDKIVARTTSIYESKIMHSKGIKNQEKGTQNTENIGMAGWIVWEHLKTRKGWRLIATEGIHTPKPTIISQR